MPVGDGFGWEDAFVFEAGASKVEEESDGGLGSGEVGDDLSKFFVAEAASEGFVFNHDAVVDPVVEAEVFEPLVLAIVDFDRVFFDRVYSECLEFEGEGGFRPLAG